MLEATFIGAFFLVWLFALAYVLSVLRLALRVRQLRREGRALRAPDSLEMPLGAMAGVGWLVTGRYAELGDAFVPRWSKIGRLLFLLVLPMILAIFAIAASRILA